MSWGSGSAATDTQLLRSGVNTLQTPGAIIHNLISPGTCLLTKLSTDAFGKWQVDQAGKIQWGPGTASTGDVSLARTAVGILSLSGVLGIAQSGSAPGASVGFSNIVAGNNNMLFQEGPSTGQGFLSQAAASDFTATTVTGTGNNLCGKVWTIPAADAAVGDCYEFDLQIFGKQGTTAETINLGWALNGTSVGSATLANAFAAISSNFICKAKLTITIVTAGAGGTYTWLIEASGAGGNIPQQNIGGPVTSALPAINTTVANTIQFNGGFGASTVGCTFTTSVTRMRKIA
jgi:hypothetical protein